MPVDQRTLDQLSLIARGVRPHRRPARPRAERGRARACSARSGPSTAATRTAARCSRCSPTEGPCVLTKVGEENAGVVDIGDGLGVVVQDRVAQPPVGDRAVRGRGDRRRRHRPRHLRDGRAADRAARLAALRPAARTSAQPLPVQRRRRRHRRLRQLHRHPDGRRRGVASRRRTPATRSSTRCASASRGSTTWCGARADGPGNLLMLVGADTGRDGIHGATFCLARVRREQRGARPAVQVGNPFMEKLLHRGVPGAGGEAPRLDRRPAGPGRGRADELGRRVRREGRHRHRDRRGAGAAPRAGHDAVRGDALRVAGAHARHRRSRSTRTRCAALFERWELHSDVIGGSRTTAWCASATATRGGAACRSDLLTDAPEYRRARAGGRHWLDEAAGLRPGCRCRTCDGHGGLPATTLLDAAGRRRSIADKRWVWRQYDHQVRHEHRRRAGQRRRGAAHQGHEEGASRSRPTATAVYCYLDPYAGGAIAVAEAARNVVCTGAKPIAMTNCLNFGNPEKPEVYYQLKEAIRGMADACRALGTPVISGNVSLYNETNGEAICPTPVVGMVGLLEDVERAARWASSTRATTSSCSARRSTRPLPSLAGSEYLREMHGRRRRAAADRPRPRGAGAAGLPGGDPPRSLAVRLTIARRAGWPWRWRSAALPAAAASRAATRRRAARLDAALFGEAQSRIIVSCAAEGSQGRLGILARDANVPLTHLGRVGGKRLILPGLVDVAIEDLATTYHEGLPRALAGR